MQNVSSYTERGSDCGCFSWIKSTLSRKNSCKHESVALGVPTQTSPAPNSGTLVIANNTSLDSFSPWEDWKINGGDEFLRKWDFWNRKCMEENQADLEVRNVLEKIWKTLQGMLEKARERGQQVLQSDLFKAALDVIPNNVGFPAGALIKVLVQLILLGLRLASAERQVYNFTIEVVTDMNRIAGAFGKGTTDESALRQCWEDLEETRKTVNEICAWANKTLDEHVRLGVSAAITEFEKKLEHARKMFSQLATIRQLRYLADHGQKIDEILGHQVSLQRIERIKTALGSRVVSKAIYANWDTKERQYKRPCHPETRDIVLTDIDGWIHNPDTTSCLWITGMAGVGKSAIALTTAECLKDGRAISAKSDSETIRNKVSGATLVGEYFVSFRDVTTNSIESLFPTIAMQLADTSTIAQVIIDDALKQIPTIAYEFNLNQAQLLFVEPLRALSECNPNNLVIIIDGVDEFVGDLTHANQEALHRTVTSTLCDVMSRLPPNVKVLILSRRERGIAEVLDERPNNIRQLPLPIDESRDDVIRFLKPSLKDYAAFSHRRWEDWPDEQQFSVLYYLAGGHFTCASVAFRWIVSELDSAEDPEIRRNEVFDDLRGAELTGLDELYGFVLAREILDKSGKLIQFRLDVISCLVLLQAPISNIGVLSALLGLETRRVLDVVQRTRSLLFEEIEPITEQTVLKPHKSFVDFIISSRDKRFPVDVAKSHHQLAEGCLRILLDPDKLHFNMACINSIDDDPTGDKLIVAHVGYACLAFPHHVVNAAESAVSGIPPPVFVPQLLNFLENQFLFWLEVLVLLPELDLDEVFHLLKLLRDRMEPHDHLTHLLDDVLMFMSYFEIRDSINELIGIYLTYIPFAPACSLIATHYRARYLSSLSSIIPHPNDKWDEQPQPYSPSTWIVSAATDGNRILISIQTDNSNGSIQCFDAQSGAELSSFRHDWYGVWLTTTCALSLNGKFLVVGHTQTRCRVWNTQTGEEEKWAVMEVPEPDSIRSLSFSPDNSHIVAGCESGDIHVWSCATEIPTSPFSGHTGAVRSIAYSACGTRIVSGSDDGTVRVWDISSRACIFTPPAVGRRLDDARLHWPIATFSPNGSQIASALFPGTIEVWNILDPQTQSAHSLTLERPLNDYVHSLTYSPNGQFLLLGHGDCIAIWDISTGQRIAILTGHTEPVYNLAFFPDGKRLLSMPIPWGAGIDDTVRVWDIESLLNGQKSEADDAQWDSNHEWIVNADRQRLFRPPRLTEDSGANQKCMPFRHPRNTVVIGKCLPTPSFSPIAYDEEWKSLESRSCIMPERVLQICSICGRGEWLRNS